MSRRIIAVCIPWLVAEHVLRVEGMSGLGTPFAVVEQAQGTQRLAGVNQAGSKAGLSAGMGLSDARAICPGLATKPLVPERLSGFVRALVRWAERFSPLCGQDAGQSLIIDATGVAHLFGGEPEMLDAVEISLAEIGLTARAAIADTKGAAWALAHFADRSRRLSAPGRTRQAIASLPVAALRIESDAADGLGRVGLTTIEPLTRMPRGALARRFGIECMRRLDQATGAEPEPVAPASRIPVFAVRMTMPEPIGLVSDVMAGLERLLERLCQQLETHQMGARRLGLACRRVDGADQRAEIALARPGRDPMRLRDLFERKVSEIEAGFGIDALRLSALEVEPLKPAQMTQAHRETAEARLHDLISRLGNRIGFEQIGRLVPAESHIPPKAFVLAAAAYSAPADWRDVAARRPPRPVTLFPPEAVRDMDQDGKGAGALNTAVPAAPPRSLPHPETHSPAHSPTRPPRRFLLGGRALESCHVRGPERIAPEWWWDDPDWRSGPRDYWQVETRQGPRLWLFHTPAARTPGWYAEGEFA